MVSVTERVKTLFFSPLQPRNAGGGGGGGVGGYPVPASLQAPTSAAAVSAVSHPFACLPPGDFFGTTEVQPQTKGPSPKALEARPQGPGGPAPRPWRQGRAQPQAWHLGRHFLRRSASIQNTAVITAQAPARIRPAFGRVKTFIHNPTATKNYVSTKLPRLESATPTATRQYVFADEVPHPHGTGIASTAYDDRRDLAADPFLRRLCDRTPFTRVGPAVRTIRVQVRPP